TGGLCSPSRIACTMPRSSRASSTRFRTRSLRSSRTSIRADLTRSLILLSSMPTSAMLPPTVAVTLRHPSPPGAWRWPADPEPDGQDLARGLDHARAACFEDQGERLRMAGEVGGEVQVVERGLLDVAERSGDAETLPAPADRSQQEVAVRGRKGVLEEEGIPPHRWPDRGGEERVGLGRENPRRSVPGAPALPVSVEREAAGREALDEPVAASL